MVTVTLYDCLVFFVNMKLYKYRKVSKNYYHKKTSCAIIWDFENVKVPNDMNLPYYHYSLSSTRADKYPTKHQHIWICSIYIPRPPISTIIERYIECVS